VGRSVRWVIAVAILVAAFFAVWGACALAAPRVKLDVVLSLAGLATAVLSLPVGAWAAPRAERVQKSRPGSEGRTLAVRFPQVVVGEIPREPPAFQPRHDLSDRLAAVGGVTAVRALTGARGVGKTQLAAAYARARIAEGWPVIGWIVADDSSRMLEGLERLGRALGLITREDDSESAAAKVRGWLETEATGSCLVVFDNAVDPEAVRRWLPAGGRARIVVTSTSTAFEDFGISVGVDVFSVTEALDFLRRRTGSAELEGARAVAEELGFLPLALGQAAATIRTQRLTYATFLDRLRSLPVDQYLTRRSSDSYPRGAAQAVLLSLAAAEAAGVFTKALTGLIAVLSPAGIHRDILTKAGELDAVGAVTAADVDMSVGRLAEASLLTFSVDGESVIMHRFTRRVVQDRDRSDGSLAGSILLACQVLTKMQIPQDSAWSERTRGRHIVQQIDALWETATSGQHPVAGQAPDFIRAVLKLRSWAVRYLWGIEDSAQAISAGIVVVSNHEDYLGNDCEETVFAREGLALGYGGIGRHDEAIALHESMMVWCERSLDTDDKKILSLRNNLANNYMESAEDYHDPSRLDKAVELHEANYDACMRVLGEEAFMTLLSGDNLSRAYRKIGRLQDAAALNERILRMRRRVSGIDIQWTLFSQASLAETYWELGRVDEAFALLEQTLGQVDSIFVADTPISLEIRVTMAKLRQKSGNVAAATGLYEGLVAGARRTVGNSHAILFHAQEGLAISYEEAGRLDDAATMYSQMVATCTLLVGPDSRITRRAEQCLTRLRQMKEKKNEPN
jgi:tetratricopeptide (TPR) repeat protein